MLIAGDPEEWDPTVERCPIQASIRSCISSPLETFGVLGVFLPSPFVGWKETRSLYPAFVDPSVFYKHPPVDFPPFQQLDYRLRQASPLCPHPSYAHTRQIFIT